MIKYCDIGAEAIARRAAGEPLDNILGYRSFFGRDFSVSTDVLSPRDDTETLVLEVLPALKATVAAGGVPRVLDLGTGSGALGVTLKLECPGAEVWATDVSGAALAVARGNAETFGAEVRFREGSWFGAFGEGDGPFDLIVSNPPYIDDATMETLEREVRDFDPDISLRGGADGLVAYRAILEDVRGSMRDWLVPGGRLVVEIGYDQGESVPELFRLAGLEEVRVVKDLAQNDRVVVGRAPVSLDAS